MVTPWIISRDTARLLDFVKEAFGAEEMGRVPAEVGSIGHAEFRIGDSVVMAFDSKPEWPGTPAFLRLYLGDGDEVMRHAYAGPVKLADVSARAHLSPYHFLRVHRRAFGETPHEFLTRVRIERAKTLLAGGGHSVTEVCFEVGFSSLGSFSALFRRRVGLTPSEYRRYARFGILVPREVRPLFVPGCFAAMVFGMTAI